MEWGPVGLAPAEVANSKGNLRCEPSGAAEGNRPSESPSLAAVCCPLSRPTSPALEMLALLFAFYAVIHSGRCGPQRWGEKADWRGPGPGGLTVIAAHAISIRAQLLVIGYIASPIAYDACGSGNLAGQRRADPA